jgi:hypothetical protein
VRLVLFAAVSTLLAGCSSGGGGGHVSRRADRCADLFLRTAAPAKSQVTRAEIRRYILVTYCDRFAAKGWVYPDGALSIDAQRWLDRGTSESCSTSSPGGKSMTVPCSTLPRERPRIIDCGLLHRVRRSEVRLYLRNQGRVRCDDGTPLAALGVG